MSTRNDYINTFFSTSSHDNGDVIRGFRGNQVGFLSPVRGVHSPTKHTANGNGLNERTKPPDKPNRKVNVQESLKNHRSWTKNFGKPSGTPGTPESVDSARRSSVNKENTPNRMSGFDGVPRGARSTPMQPLPSRSLTTTSNSMDAFINNWKTPTSSG